MKLFPIGLGKNPVGRICESSIVIGGSPSVTCESSNVIGGSPVWLVRAPLWLVGAPVWLVRAPMWLVRAPMWLVRAPMWLVGAPVWLVRAPMWLVRAPLWLVGAPVWLVRAPMWLVRVLMWLYWPHSMWMRSFLMLTDGVACQRLSGWLLGCCVSWQIQGLQNVFMVSWRLMSLLRLNLSSSSVCRGMSLLRRSGLWRRAALYLSHQHWQSWPLLLTLMGYLEFKVVCSSQHCHVLRNTPLSCLGVIWVFSWFAFSITCWNMLVCLWSWLLCGMSFG